jgi:hypothetical protein
MHNYAPNNTCSIKNTKDLINYNKIHFPPQQKTQIKTNTNNKELTKKNTVSAIQ